MNGVDSPKFWQEIYEAGDTRWDMGSPTPAFIRLHRQLLFPPGTMLVPGCGRGYDAIHFATNGFDVTAVDFADSAIRDASALAERAGATLHLLQEDVFNLSSQYPAHFDYVLEYTCYCAIAPERRGEYVEVIAKVLKPGGLFIGMMFPLDDRPGGPPFAVQAEEIQRLFGKKFVVVHDEAPADSVSPRAGKERLMIWKRNE